MEWGESRERGDVCLIMADLCCCMAETNTTLFFLTNKLKKKKNATTLKIALSLYTSLATFYLVPKYTIQNLHLYTFNQSVHLSIYKHLHFQ